MLFGQLALSVTIKHVTWCQ